MAWKKGRAAIFKRFAVFPGWICAHQLTCLSVHSRAAAPSCWLQPGDPSSSTQPPHAALKPSHAPEHPGLCHGQPEQRDHGDDSTQPWQAAGDFPT